MERALVGEGSLFYRYILPRSAHGNAAGIKFGRLCGSPFIFPGRKVDGREIGEMVSVRGPDAYGE